MANPFTAFAFPASGAGVTTNITLPTRLAYVKNVKDFGAVGDGVTDDWPAIMAAVNWTTSNDRGTLYFPPGTYLVSQPIDFTGTPGAQCAINWRGELALSTITGNFADFIFKSSTQKPLSSLDKLNIVNTNATGGGITFSSDNNYTSIRNCTFAANRGILQGDGSGGGPLDCAIENCIFGPGSNQTNSYGIFVASNGPFTNCRFIGLDTGMFIAGQEGAAVITGCYFEQCKTGMDIGTLPNGSGVSTGDLLIAGCYFKNCSTAMNFTPGSGSFSTIVGIRIDAAAGGFRGGNSQYGIFGSKTGDNFFGGIDITGTYDHFGITIPGVGSRQNNVWAGINSVSWSLGTGQEDQYFGCNVAPLFTVANLPVAGQEGFTYNISDGTASLAWGATVTGTGSLGAQYLVRDNGSNYTVMGQ